MVRMTRPYECDCSCHEPGSDESHLAPCCQGRCRRCNVYVTSLKKHAIYAHAGDLDEEDGWWRDKPRRHRR